MVAVAMLLIWGGYGTSLWGWCLFRDYDLTFGQLMSPLHPYSGKWPPAKLSATQLWPGGASTTAAAPAASTSPAPSSSAPPVVLA